MQNNNLCRLCPRECMTDRTIGNKGFCGCDNKLYVARAALHLWEEPCISGENGSGTVFFSGCTLKCVYCQNGEIANCNIGKEITVERLSQIFLELMEKGAHNINLVTPTHYTLHIVEALKIAKEKGLSIPVIYNTSGYERVETLEMLSGLVDIYLPDFKYFSRDLSKRYSNAENYFEYAEKAIEEMYRQVGAPVFNDSGLMKKGVIVRHLVLPNHSDDSMKIIKYLYNTYGDNIYLSIMNQYTPMPSLCDSGKYPELSVKLSEKEYERVLDYAINLGIENAFIQEGETANESFIPNFNFEGV